MNVINTLNGPHTSISTDAVPDGLSSLGLTQVAVGMLGIKDHRKLMLVLMNDFE